MQAHRISGNTRLISWGIPNSFSVKCVVLTALKVQSILLKLLCHYFHSRLKSAIQI